MEYYNSLLESYDLLKKRKFKLSLKEQDVGGGSTDDQIQTVISTATGSPSSKPGEAQTINDVELWLKKGTQRVMGRLGSRNGELVGENGQRVEGPNQDMMWKNMFPGEEEPTPDKGPVDTGVDTQPLLTANTDLGKFIERLKDFEEGNLEDQLEKIKLNQTLLQNIPLVDMEETLRIVTEFLNLSLLIYNNPVDANKGNYAERITKFLEDNDVIRTPEGVILFNGHSIGITSDESPLGRAIRESAREIDRVQRRKVAKARGGKRIVRKALPDADRGTVGELMDSLEPDFEKCLEQGFETKTRKDDQAECNAFFDKLIDRVAAGEGKLVAERVVETFLIGIAAGKDQLIIKEEETIDVAMARYVRNKIMERNGMTEDQVEEYFDLLMGRYSDDTEKQKVAMEALFMMVFANGDFARAIHGDAVPTRTEGTGQGQAGRSDLTGAKVDALDIYCKDDGYEGKERIRNQIKENLLSEEQIKYYESACPPRSIDDILDNDLIRDPDEWCYQVDREIKIHGKEEGSGSTWGETSHDKRRALWDHLCEDTKGSDEGEFYQTQAANITLDDKEKTFMDNIKEDFLGSFCEDKETKEQGVANRKKGEAALLEACEFNNQMDREIDPYLKILQPGAWVDGVPDAAGEMVGQWFDKKYGPSDKEKARTRAKSAIGCMKLSQTRMNNMERMKEYQEMDKASRDKKEPIPMDPADQADYQTAQEDQKNCKELDKMKGEIQNAVFTKHLDRDTDENGYLIRGGLGFVKLQSMATSMGHNETLNDKRILEEDIQKSGLRNAEQRANIKHAKYKRSKRGGKWTTTVSIINEDLDPKEKGDRTQRTRATFNAERGEYKVKSGTSKNVFNTVKKSESADPESFEDPRKSPKDPVKKKTKTGEDSSGLFKDYLKGQQKLLEILLNQTT